MLTSWRTGSLQLFNINEIIYSIESVLPGSWFLGFPDFKLSPKYGYAPSGQFRRFGLNFNEINTSRNRRLLCIQQAWQEQLWRFLARILMLLRLFLWRTGCGRANGSDFGWKSGIKTRKIYGKTLKNPLDTLKKHQNNRSYLVEVFLLLNWSSCK